MVTMAMGDMRSLQEQTTAQGSARRRWVTEERLRRDAAEHRISTPADIRTAAASGRLVVGRAECWGINDLGSAWGRWLVLRRGDRPDVMLFLGIVDLGILFLQTVSW
jgi:hypothetical protein